MTMLHGKRSVWPLLLPFLCSGWAGVLYLWGAAWRIPVAHHESLIVWQCRLMPAIRWPLIGITLVLCVMCWRLLRRTDFSGTGQVSSRWGWPFAPLVWSPFPAAFALCGDLLPFGVVANGLFYGQISIIVWVAVRLYATSRRPSGIHGSSVAWILFLLASLAYGAGGYYLSIYAGEHVGDEGHYLIQTESLYDDGDLDIQNNLTAELIEEYGKAYLHVAPASRAPHCYSWHPIGLPVLACPFHMWKMIGHHLLLGLIAGFGVTGLFLLNMKSRAGMRASLVVALAVGCSTYWVLYAFRFLPETLGATLLIWSFWGVSAQRQRPWSATFITVLMNSYLPFAHTRFIPLSLMAFGFFGLMGLFGCKDERWGQRIVRLTVFSLLSFVGYGAFLYIQFRMYIG
ncbi:MAG: hypothetical protein EOL87_18055 [Spartobacteria bacterium]|nr:hypothetical protein [Spartobacteria bacterium]